MAELGRNPRTDHTKYAGMDPNVRERFHEFGDAISRIEGMVAAVVLRVPESPAEVPVLAEKVRNLESGQSDMKAQITETDRKLSVKVDAVDIKVDALNEKLNVFALKVAGGTAVLTALVTGIVSIATKGSA